MKPVLRLCTHFSVVLKFLFAVCCVLFSAWSYGAIREWKR
jgi:hypothetical protein